MGIAGHSWAMYRFSVRLKEPLAWRGQLLHERRGVMLAVRAAHGEVHWGEACPLPGWSRESLEEAETALLAYAREQMPPATMPASARFAVDAAEQGWAHRAGVLRVNFLADARADLLPAGLFSTPNPVIKFKVAGLSPSEAVEHITRHIAALPSGSRVRVDPNRAWHFDDVAAVADAWRALPLDYLEEPLADSARHRELQERTGVPIALDETLREKDADAWADLRWAAAWVLKPTLSAPPLGDWARLQIISGGAVPCVFSSSVESGVGLRALAGLALAYGNGAACGLDTHRLLADDMATPAFVPDENGTLSLRPFAVHENHMELIANGTYSMSP